MKVAVITTRQIPAAGGAHTFEQFILGGILQARAAHTFLIMDLDGAILAVPDPSLASSGLLVHPDAPDGHSGPFVPSELDGSDHAFSIRHPYRSAQERGPHDLAGTLEAEGVDFLLFLAPVCIETCIPYALTVWDLQHRIHPFFPEVSSSGWTWSEREAFYQRFLPRAAAVITGTSVGRDEIVRCYGVHPANVIVNPMPAPPAALAPDAVDRRLTESPLDDLPGLVRGPYFLYPAQFWPHKNHANLLLALSLLRDVYGLEPALVLTGSDKGNLAYITSLTESLGLVDQVHFMGFIDALDLSLLYTKASALIFPTFFGPDNLPPLEAFVHGCPVLTSDGDGPREQLADAALFFDPTSPSEMAVAMHAILTDQDLRRTLVGRGYAMADQRTITGYISRLIHFLDRFEAIRFTWPKGYVHS